MKRISILLLVILLYATASYATTYHVATTGNDTNDGSSGSPWKTIKHSFSVVVAGDTVNIHGGTYSEYLTSAPSGTSGNPITWQVASSADTVIIQPSSSDAIARFVAASYMVWQGSAGLYNLIFDCNNVADRGLDFNSGT